MSEQKTPLNDRDELPSEEGEIISRLLRLAGPRPDAPQGTRERVKAAVRHRWLQTVKARRRRRVLIWSVGSLAAASLVVAVGLSFRRNDVTVPAAAVRAGTVVLCVGTVHGPDGSTLRAGSELLSGALLETGEDARAALRLSMGAIVRLDTGTRLALEGGSLLRLERGAIYVDSGQETQHVSGLEIRTEIGVVRDIGTRFEVRAENRELRVRVRQGAVAVAGRGPTLEIAAGTQLTVDAAGNPRTESVLTHGAAWDWILGVAPQFELQGRTLGEFLGWVSTETGLRVAFAPGVDERESLGIVLHGSVAGLRPDQAPDAVLPACGLSHRVDGSTLVVGPGIEGRRAQ